MKEFKSIVYKPSKIKSELAAFGKLLADNSSLRERADLLPFFRKHEQLSAFIGTCAPNIGPATHLAYEFPFLGDFAADIVVGNRRLGEYIVVELEDGLPDSIFTKRSGKVTKEWSRRFNHGFSQLIDWFSCLDDYRKTNKFSNEFGHGYVTFFGLLIIGRNAKMSEGDRARLKWRTTKVVVDSHIINCVTFDDLYEVLQRRLELYSKVANLEND